MAGNSGETLKRRGKFITFEGIDGCGKTTQLGMLAAHLTRLGISFVTTREPGGTSVGDQIRNVLLSSATANLTPEAELLLYFAARAQNLRQIILPAIEAGKIVLCDRFTDASIAYQGYARGVNVRFITALHRMFCGKIQPDLTLVLDIDPRTSVSRADLRNSESALDEGRFEQEGIALQERARKGYRALARRYPHRMKLLNGEDTIDRVHGEVMRVVGRLLRLPRPKRAPSRR